MPTCPAGHQSTASDFCDTCGMRIEGAPAAATATAGATAGQSGTVAAGETCPQCGADRSGQFCEACGFDYSSGAPAVVPAVQPSPASPEGAVNAASPAPQALETAWTTVVTADHDYYEAVIAAGGPDADSIEFPGYCPERRFTLSGKEMRIGRRSVSRGLEPEIDLTGPPVDPGVSHLHAVLIAKPDGSWSVLDPGSSNGTQVNGDDIASGVEVPLHSGDRVCLGAWTVLTIQST
jgi:hypothetical protein